MISHIFIMLHHYKVNIIERIVNYDNFHSFVMKNIGKITCCEFRRSFKTSSACFHNHDKSVRIGCASGFWGDTTVAATQLVKRGNIDFLVFDYLSEITMSLMTAAKMKYPSMGFAPDFVQTAVGPLLKEIKQKNIKVLSNAGGVNPMACAAALKKLVGDLDLRIATVTGDDLMSQVDEVKAKYSNIPKKITSMNAYLGAGAMTAAIAEGADIVITGRCVDSALVLAPLMYTFNWNENDWNKMAMGSLAGHLIECGAQVTGGIYTDWHKVDGWDVIGFPIVEVFESGNFAVSKPEGTGGLVSVGTVSEQLLYELENPAQYFLPDVICDFTQVQLQQIKENEVSVMGAVGRPPTDTYKVCATWHDGYRSTAVCCVGGPNAIAKSRKTADAIIRRCKRIFAALKLPDFSQINVQVLGSEQTYGPHARCNDNLREAVIWIAASHSDKRGLEIFSSEIAPAGTGMAPGLTGIVGGRPKVSPVLKLHSFLAPKSDFKVSIQLEEREWLYQLKQFPKQQAEMDHSEACHATENDVENLKSSGQVIRLEELAYTRSGDKGNNVNIGVIARNAEDYPLLKSQLTEKTVGHYFAHLFNGSPNIKRHMVPGICGLNFVLYEALGGGGIASLRSDPQGKAVGQMLLDFEIIK